MSRTASTAPTSWRCTCSGGTPCTWPSASPLIPAAGSRIAIRMGKLPNINRLAPVEPPGPGVEQHHAVRGPHGAAPLELDGGGEGRAPFRRRVDPLSGLELPRGGGERRVA